MHTKYEVWEGDKLQRTFTSSFSPLMLGLSIVKSNAPPVASSTTLLTFAMKSSNLYSLAGKSSSPAVYLHRGERRWLWDLSSPEWGQHCPAEPFKRDVFHAGVLRFKFLKISGWLTQHIVFLLYEVLETLLIPFAESQQTSPSAGAWSSPGKCNFLFVH